MTGAPIAPRIERQTESRRLVRELCERGVELRVENGVLRWRAGDGALTVALIRRIKRHQVEIIAILEEGEGHHGNANR